MTYYKQKPKAVIGYCPSCGRKRVKFIRRPYAGDYIAWCKCGKTLLRGFDDKRVKIARPGFGIPKPLD